MIAPEHSSSRPPGRVSRIQHVMVVGGAGLMGNGISEVVAKSGFDVTIVDLDKEALERGTARLDRSLRRAVEKGICSEQEAAAAKARIAVSTDLEGVARQCDHAIETVVEDFDVKCEVLSRLDRSCREEVVLASNTSQFSISSLAACTSRPDRVIGSHWFNPPPTMRLIELVCGVETSEQTLATAVEICDRYGKETIVCKKDSQGFITSRLIALLMLEAARIVDEGIAEVEDVNKACVLAFNHAQGPLDTADLSGLDTLERVSNSMVESFGERFRPPQLLRSLVHAGHHGRKTGRGFSDYEDRA